MKTRINHVEGLLLSLADQGNLADFTNWFDENYGSGDIYKLGEGSSGQVFRVHDREDKRCALKVILIDQKRLEEGQIEEISNEINILRRMTGVGGYIAMNQVKILRGKPKKKSDYVKAWKQFDREREADEQETDEQESAHRDPLRLAASQLWMVIEMADAGKSISKDEIWTSCFIWDVFWGAALALANGELHAEFEHRDLHANNICISPSQNHIDPTRKLSITGREIVIIDYELSRARLDNEDTSNGSYGGPTVAFNDLNKKDQYFFEGEGGQVYKEMRNILLVFLHTSHQIYMLTAIEVQAILPHAS